MQAETADAEGRVAALEDKIEALEAENAHLESMKVRCCKQERAEQDVRALTLSLAARWVREFCSDTWWCMCLSLMYWHLFVWLSWGHFFGCSLPEPPLRDLVWMEWLQPESVCVTTGRK